MEQIRYCVVLTLGQAKISPYAKCVLYACMHEQDKKILSVQLV